MGNISANPFKYSNIIELFSGIWQMLEDMSWVISAPVLIITDRISTFEKMMPLYSTEFSITWNQNIRVSVTQGTTPVFS